MDALAIVQAFVLQLVMEIVKGIAQMDVRDRVLAVADLVVPEIAQKLVLAIVQVLALVHVCINAKVDVKRHAVNLALFNAKDPACMDVPVVHTLV